MLIAEDSMTRMRILGLFLAVLLVPLSGQSVGAFANLGYGTAGPSVVPGATLQWGKVPIQIHVGYGDGILEAATYIDYLLFDQRIPGTDYSWYVGPGVFGAWGSDFSALQVWGVGGRLVVGASTANLAPFELYMALTPALGYTWLNGTPNLLWNAGIETGVRYAFGNN